MSDPQPSIESLASLTSTMLLLFITDFLIPTEYRDFKFSFFFLMSRFLDCNMTTAKDSMLTWMSNKLCEEQADEGEVFFYSLSSWMYTHTHIFSKPPWTLVKSSLFKEARQRSTENCLPKMAPWKLHNSLSSVWGYRNDGLIKTQNVSPSERVPKIAMYKFQKPSLSQ